VGRSLVTKYLAGAGSLHVQYINKSRREGWFVFHGSAITLLPTGCMTKYMRLPHSQTLQVYSNGMITALSAVRKSNN